MLDKQINLFKVDTNAFLFDYEYRIKHFYDKITRNKKEILDKLYIKYKNDKENISYKDYSKKLKKSISKSKQYYKKYILDSAKKNVDNNYDKTKQKQIRKLNRNRLYYIDKNGIEQVAINNVISMFESALTRSFGIKTNELTYDIFIVEIYYYDIAQDLIANGFDYDNKHYVYFSSSAGQIRTKKAVFVEEEKYNKCKLKLMCGLTIDKINSLGGMNVNKFLAYLALSNSATETWDNVFGKSFDIDKCIVVDDFETNVNGIVDNIDYNTYEITNNVRQDIPIPHTDGCGMILSSYSNKNFMIRLPWIKGLLGVFDFKKFIKTNKCSSIVKDIWGKEYDIIKDDIQIIFTKSQLKMYKYYSSWDEYKKYFKEYNCEAGVCNMEEDYIPNAKINYQMLQSLYKITDKEIADICKYPNKKITEISDSLDNMLKFYGVEYSEDIDDKDNFYQKSLRLYPELLRDSSCKEDLRDLRNSLVNKYRSGRLDIMGKFTFVLPDLYAFCEWLFLDIKVPNGLLANKEVYCRLYKNKSELDCLRSPSLYIEHAIRNNVCNKQVNNIKISDWFTTDAVYTSTYDLISRILQFDVDGDRLLVLSQQNIIDVAKRCMDGVHPLYYEMKKAKAEILTPQSIYNGLKLAFTGGNIGIISNDITKIWNQSEIDEKGLKAIRWLCMETNFTIDYAKTLFKPTRPDEIDKILKKYHNMNLPYFFKYAKNKEYETKIVDGNEVLSEKSQVDFINNSFMNSICHNIVKTKIIFNNVRKLGKLDYLMLLKNKKDCYSNDDINNCYIKWNKKYGNNLNVDKDKVESNNLNYLFNEIKQEFLSIEPNEQNIVNSLVRLLYEKNSCVKKKLLWFLYGEILYTNIYNNIDKNTSVCKKCGKRVNKNSLLHGLCEDCLNKKKKIFTHCSRCGKLIKIKSKYDSSTKYCEDCARKMELENTRLRVKKFREK